MHQRSKPSVARTLDIMGDPEDVLYFAAQGGGRVLWPFLGGTARLVVAAGLGWWAIARWGFGLPTLFAIVAAAIVISPAISFVATLSGAIWRTGPE
jgi:hypothetical protein